MHVAVIGGGISGATAAYRLRGQLGAAATITLFESGDRLGGKLRTIELAGQPYDVGAEAFLARRPEALALAKETGLGDRLTHPTGARSTIRAGGQQVGMPGGTVMGVPGSPEAVAGVLSEDGRRRVEAEAGLPPVRLDGDVALGALLRERFGDELVDRLVDPLLGGVYAGGADGLGLRATVPALASAIEKGARSLTEAAASLVPASPSAAPVFGTLAGGLGTLVERLVELAKPDVRLNTLVRGLRRTPAGFRLELVDEAVDVDAVLLAVPAPAARRLLEDVAPAASSALGSVEVASMAVVALALPPDAAVPDASGVLISAGEPLASKAFTFSSRKWPHFGDSALFVRGSVGRFGEPGALRADDEELVRLVRADLAELTGVTAEPLDTYVMRWGGGLPQYGVGHLDVVARVEREVARVPGLAVAGAALHGVGVPACIATATAAASRITSGPLPGGSVPS
ncbi:oxygen-dependent protoporphyrinogen oxidase [Amycolatopsis bartoniae]|uniref:Coproporphyrinogen III oxidase n=1 Tax=Amycolatopsis bartoniae TaxID=941986 RepID=A0A8H9MEU4_9PSEU|nr:protoporphyrinogen oxidase [Amycolatopsis bartoniae]MBB2939062.1 oxygen-dependent protoporphyrinogen oxidase [Amycolatopsis bartoniae]GHF65212.1 protoporphyrinogen oxidase [Amycolatopsis bartoniae]